MKKTIISDSNYEFFIGFEYATSFSKVQIIVSFYYNRPRRDCWCEANHCIYHLKCCLRSKNDNKKRCFEILYISVMKILVCLVNKRLIIKVFVTRKVKFIFNCRFYFFYFLFRFLGNISCDKYNSFRWKRQVKNP
jgi:hypothetical protein